jgi:hypothetical protein
MAYPIALAKLLGYDLDPDELEPVTGLHPELVFDRATTGARHAITYTRTLLGAQTAFLRESPSPADGHLLADLEHTTGNSTNNSTRPGIHRRLPRPDRHRTPLATVIRSGGRPDDATA